MFLNATVPLAVLRAHFRRFLYVQLPDGRTVYFRFYDPRVLRVYLATCTPPELEVVLGSVERFLVEGEEELTLLRFARDRTAAVTEVSR